MAKQNSLTTQHVVKRYLYQVSFGPPTFTDSPPMIAAIQSFWRDVPYGPWPFSDDSPRNDGTSVLQYSCGRNEVDALNSFIIGLLVRKPGAYTTFECHPFDYDGTNDPVENDDWE